uniref:Uncharacterized protein n=1 Tax=Photinus pyralis TaxID=7054 RepID=A0A1Y1LLR3_PHOPY
MRCPSLNFITLHYAYIFVMGLLSIPFLYLYGNISAIDAYFMGSSASTESGLNVANLNELKLYQQLYLYFTTVFTQMGFVNILVVVVRLYWFNKHLSSFGPALLHARRRGGTDSQEDSRLEYGELKVSPPDTSGTAETRASGKVSEKNGVHLAADDDDAIRGTCQDLESEARVSCSSFVEEAIDASAPHISFDSSADKLRHPRSDSVLYVPGPRDRDLADWSETEKQRRNHKVWRRQPPTSPSDPGAPSRIKVYRPGRRSRIVRICYWQGAGAFFNL